MPSKLEMATEMNCGHGCSHKTEGPSDLTTLTSTSIYLKMSLGTPILTFVHTS